MSVSRIVPYLRYGLAVLYLLWTPYALAQSGDLRAILSAINDPYPLRTADTSSPRDTLRTFIRDFNQGMDAWSKDKTTAEIERPLRRAAATFDFSELPAFERISAVLTKMALLKEILDRVELPPFDQVPGDEEVENENISRWLIPNTKIEIIKTQDGPRAGQYLFSKDTVKQLERYYELAKDLPYKKGALVNLYENILSGPGIWLPRTFPDRFPNWAKGIILGQGVWQWFAVLLLALISGLLIWCLDLLGRWWDDQHTKKQATFRFGKPLTIFAIFLVAHFFDVITQNAIGMIGAPLSAISYVTLIAKVGSLAWLVLVLSDRLADIFAKKKDDPLETRRFDAALMRTFFRLVSIVALIYLGIYAAEFVGIPIAPLVAGLGVGGLAIALAVRPTLENIIGGLTLFADRPVRVGDFCAYGDKIGTVEEIGLRSTRIRSLERTIVTVPNAEFSQMQIDNFAPRDQRLLTTVLQLRYETTPEQLRYVLAALRKMLLGHPKVTPDPARVRFVSYGAYSLDLEVFAYLRCQDQGEFLAIQEDILLRMADIVNESGSGFAFPSQTLYYRRDTGVDEEQSQKAEASVEHWRQNNQLPFPDFDPGLRWEMEDILDYPPRGAYNYKYRKGLSEDRSDDEAANAAPVETKEKQ